ncbi:MAG: ADP-glyceromanno-heptose 6-epimerase [bacterium]
MKIILTGGAGFIGSCLLWKLNQEGLADITIVDHLGKSLKWHNISNKKFTDYIEKDDFLNLIRDDKLNTKTDLIIHFGACTSTIETNASYMMQNNYTYSQILARYALKHNIRFMYASSAATYGSGDQGYSDDDSATLQLKPLNIYGYSKQLFDLWVLQKNLQNKFVGFKFFNVFGPNEYHKEDMKSIIAKSFDNVNQEGVMRLFKSYRPDYADGEQKRDFIYVKDVLDISYYFITHPGKHGIYNIGTGKAQTWNDLAYALFAAVNKKPSIEYFDMPDELKNKYQYFTQADMTKLMKAGYNKPFTGLQAAIKDYAGYLKNNSFL